MRKIRILAIDDDIAILEAMEWIFGVDPELEISTLSDPRAWSQAVVAFRPDVVMVDYKMPFLSGADVVKQLRSSDLGQAVRSIVLFSATPLSKRQAQQMGADDFLQKPFDVDAMTARVKELGA